MLLYTDARGIKIENVAAYGWSSINKRLIPTRKINIAVKVQLKPGLSGMSLYY